MSITTPAKPATPQVAINDIGSAEDFLAAIDAASGGQSNVMTALRGERVEMVPLSEVAGKVKFVPDELLAVARALA